MVLESTVICIDNSDYMRNGDFVPSRMQAQQDAVDLICKAKTRTNPENNVALVTLANSSEVLTTLTTDAGKVLAKLNQVQPKGDMNFATGVRIAHLVLRHRLGRNHRMRIIVFVGSPLDVKQKELSQLAKKLKKEKVSVDIVNFGEDQEENNDLLQSFIEELRGKEGTGSHLATLGGGADLVETLARSPIVRGEDGAGAAVAAAAGGSGSGGFDFGIDPNEDPELAMALRVSMEEQRQRQEREARAVAAQSGTAPAETSQQPTTDEENMLVQALTGSGGGSSAPSGGPVTSFPDFGTMSEEDQIAYAIQMSMQEAQQQEPKKEDKKDEKKKNDESKKPTDEKREDGGEEIMEVDDEPLDTSDSNLATVAQDQQFLQSVLQTLPGMNPPKEEKKTEKKDDQK